ncbi:PBSP domain-containing protein [Nannizzia gypsea CBS 118893]|uniref:PBSP domain-containing protein n=1 Tax=Arthroderma gypseum (strain ATCC MYA-4604 / CBS 118893) TaxID=535722 RepID=E4USM8_ARTGP|nr:PBSP domain-containing protein [Nannizzia gypsea CBS 118893]EFR01379.1 PBSP domain-containing protein [Nannizzia gypsea CBS 118893]
MSESSSSAIPTPASSSLMPPGVGETDNEKEVTDNDVPQWGREGCGYPLAASGAPAVPKPKLRLHFEDLGHSASKVLIKAVPDPYAVMQKAIAEIVRYIYTSPSSGRIQFSPSLPPTSSVSFIIHDFQGVAYTIGVSSDNNQKEIHMSLSYIAHTASLKDTVAEIAGVIQHELVHCYQHTHPPGRSTPNPPSGLIEGIADFVRLKAGLGAAHWKRPASLADLPKKWDVGYQNTAFFLEWIENVRIGTGAVGLINDRLLRQGYLGVDGETFWNGLFGQDVQELWIDYAEYVGGQKPRGQDCE